VGLMITTRLPKNSIRNQFLKKYIKNFNRIQGLTTINNYKLKPFNIQVNFDSNIISQWNK